MAKAGGGYISQAIGAAKSIAQWLSQLWRRRGVSARL